MSTTSANIVVKKKMQEQYLKEEDNSKRYNILNKLPKPTLIRSFATTYNGLEDSEYISQKYSKFE